MLQSARNIRRLACASVLPARGAASRPPAWHDVQFPATSDAPRDALPGALPFTGKRFANRDPGQPAADRRTGPVGVARDAEHVVTGHPVLGRRRGGAEAEERGEVGAHVARIDAGRQRDGTQRAGLHRRCRGAADPFDSAAARVEPPHLVDVGRPRHDAVVDEADPENDGRDVVLVGEHPELQQVVPLRRRVLQLQEARRVVGPEHVDDRGERAAASRRRERGDDLGGGRQRVDRLVVQLRQRKLVGAAAQQVEVAEARRAAVVLRPAHENPRLCRVGDGVDDVPRRRRLGECRERDAEHRQQQDAP